MSRQFVFVRKYLSSLLSSLLNHHLILQLNIENLILIIKLEQKSKSLSYFVILESKFRDTIKYNTK